MSPSEVKRVLIIAYYWPPAGGPGVQRVLKFVKYLPQFGWEPIVLTVKNGEYPAIDESLLSEIPANTKVYQTDTFSPLKIYKRIMGIKGNIPTHVLSKSKNESFIKKIFKWIRVNIYVPDGRKDWIKVIEKEGLKIIEKEKPALIYSTSPPHSLQLGAKRLAQASGLKWVADFRDPWTDGFWLKSLPRMAFAKKWDLKLELSVLRAADTIITMSETWVNLFQNKIDNKYHALPNGYDDEDFEKSVAVNSDKFRIIYTGSLRESQIPAMFFNDLKTMKSDGNYQNLEMHCFGSVHPDAIELIKDLGIDDIIIRHGYVDHKVVISNLINAQVLLMLIPDTEGNEGIVPGKIFEYMGCENYILGIGPRGGEAEKLIDRYGIGRMLSFDESALVELQKRYEQWETGVKLQPKIDIKEYSRIRQCERLSEIFNELI